MTPIKITTTKGSFLFVPVPEDMIEYCILFPMSLGNAEASWRLQIRTRSGEAYSTHLGLYGDRPIIVCPRLSQITEEQAAGIVDEPVNGWRLTQSVIESFHSLLTANGADISKEHIIIKTK